MLQAVFLYCTQRPYTAAAGVSHLEASVFVVGALLANFKRALLLHCRRQCAAGRDRLDRRRHPQKSRERCLETGISQDGEGCEDHLGASLQRGSFSSQRSKPSSFLRLLAGLPAKMVQTRGQANDNARFSRMVPQCRVVRALTTSQDGSCLNIHTAPQSIQV